MRALIAALDDALKETTTTANVAVLPLPLAMVRRYKKREKPCG